MNQRTTLHRITNLGTIALALSLPWPSSKVLAQEKPETIKAAITKALPLLEKGAAGHIAERTCFSCHHQTLPVMALTVARQRGFAVNEEGFKKQLGHTHNVLAQWAKRTPDRKTFGGGQADTAGHALLTLELGNWRADETTLAVVDYLLQRDEQLGHWRNVSTRPPSEASPFTTTALALRGLAAFGGAERNERIAKRVDAARVWLLKTASKDTEERVFRLWGLKYAQAEAEALQAAAHELRTTQRADGGWAQLEKMTSDAYATGSALTALHLAGNLAVGDQVYQRGVRFLLKDQQQDGSWLVHSRSKPFQKYFETGFPHGQNQWISSSASGWAATALALALPPVGKEKREARLEFRSGRSGRVSFAERFVSPLFVDDLGQLDVRAHGQPGP